MKGALQDIKKRPALFVFILLFTAAFCALEQFNGFTRNFGSVGKLFGTDYAELLSEIANWIYSKATNPKLMLVTIGIAIVAAIALAAILGVLFSGYAYTNYVTVLDRTRGNNRKSKSTSALFAEGINRRFLKMSGYFVFVILGSIAMIGMCAYSLMPAVLSVKNVIAGDTGAIFSMVLLIAVTALILFFAIVFFAMYASFIMPSIIAFKKGSVKVALKMVNGYCWYLIPRTLGFLLYMVGISLIMLILGYGSGSPSVAVIVFISNWVFKTLGIIVYVQYVFSTYIAMKDDMFEE